MKYLLILFILAFSSSLLAHHNDKQYCGGKTTTPTKRFIDNKDGTITDIQTQLMWKKCNEGETWRKASNSCSTITKQYTWQDSLKRARSVNNKGYATHTDWRLPNIKELISIIEEGCEYPAANLRVFPSTKPDHYWSSTPLINFLYATDAWSINFNVGVNDVPTEKTNTYYLRLVRDTKE